MSNTPNKDPQEGLGFLDSKLLQSIKIDKKMDVKSKCTQHRPPQRVYNFWPSLKMCHLCHFQVPTGLEATRGPGGPAQLLQSIKID